MKVERYSLTGFKTQYQSYHMNRVMFELNEDEYQKVFITFPEHLKRYIEEQHKKNVIFFKENYKDLEKGIWVFIDGYKNNQSLNHLKKKVPCWTADLADDTEVYDVNWTKKMKLNDVECTFFGCYIPERELNRQTFKVVKRM